VLKKYKILILSFFLLFLSGCSLFAGKGSGEDLTLPALSQETEIPLASESSAAPDQPSHLPTVAKGVSEEQYRAFMNRAAEMTSEMDLRTLLLQLMVLTPETVDVNKPVLEAKGNRLEDYPVAGILLRSQNVDNRQQTEALIQGYQASSSIPLLICVEEEGGRSVTTMKKLNTTPISNMFSYRGDGRARAYENARIMAGDIRSIGFNVDLAPVADVWADPANKTIGERAYSDSYEKAAELIWEAVQGFSSQNIICCLKHFPGSGLAQKANKKDVLAVMERDLASLQAEEFLPFKAGIAAGADMIMTGLLEVPQLDSGNLVPFSHYVVTELLRGELGFEGVIISGRLDELLPLTEFTAGEACVRALQAGHDLLLCPVCTSEELEACLDYLEAALEADRLSRRQLEESVRRVLVMKMIHGIIE